MIALDTNVLARFYLNDEPRQAAVAARLLMEEDVFIPKTVLLELEWVIRGLHATISGQFFAVLEHLLALPSVTVEERLAVEAVLASHRSGLDFAPALHHATYLTCASMDSFDDRRFEQRVAKLGLLPPVTVPR